MPIPPSDAKAIAILASVTVSIAAEQNGRFKSMFFVNFVLSDTCVQDVRVHWQDQYIVKCELLSEPFP